MKYQDLKFVHLTVGTSNDVYEINVDTYFKILNNVKSYTSLDQFHKDPKDSILGMRNINAAPNSSRRQFYSIIKFLLGLV
jgi:hypothetical protein